MNKAEFSQISIFNFTDYLYQYILNLWTVCQIFAVYIAPKIHYSLWTGNDVVWLPTAAWKSLSVFQNDHLKPCDRWLVLKNPFFDSVFLTNGYLWKCLWKAGNGSVNWKITLFNTVRCRVLLLFICLLFALRYFGALLRFGKAALATVSWQHVTSSSSVPLGTWLEQALFVAALTLMAKY